MKKSQAKCYKNIVLRPFTTADIQLLYRWQSVAGMRRYFRDSGVPTWEDHVKWCRKNIEDKDTYLYIIESASEPSGYIRVSLSDCENEYEVSILLEPNFRGKSIARSSLEAVKEMFFDKTLVANIYPENKASIKLFLATGFVADFNKSDWYRLEQGN